MNVSAVAGNGEATISFTAPNNGGSPITLYTVTSSPEGITVQGVSSPLIITRLTNGTAYTFTVVATNAVGDSVASSASSAVTPSLATVPDPPTSVLAGGGYEQSTVSFTAPKQLFVLMVGASSANSRSFITLRPNDDSGEDYSVGGFYVVWTDSYASTATNSGGLGAYSTNTDIAFGTMGTGANSIVHGSFFMDLTDKTGNKYYKVDAGASWDSATGGPINYATQGLYESSSTITSIAVLSSTGNFDAGTIYVFGAN
jgi:hypothetical protein